MLCTEPLSSKEYHDYGFCYLEKYFEIQIWVSPVNERAISKNPHKYNGSNVHQTRYFFQIEWMIRNNDQCLFVMAENARNYYRKLMIKYHCRYFFILSIGSSCPVDSTHEIRDRNMRDRENFIDRAKRRLSGGYRWMIWAVRNKIVDGGKIIELENSSNPPKWIFSSSVMIDGAITKYEKTQVIYVPSVDYNRYIEIKKDDENEPVNYIDYKYILFVDSGLGFKMRGLMPKDYTDCMYEKEYRKKHFEAIEKTFSVLEKHYGFPVVIAAHPNIDYEGYNYGGRKMVVGDNTAMLVKHSIFCVYRFTSVSMSYAILYNKPILFLYDDISKMSWNWNYTIAPMMKELNIKGCDMSNDCDRRKPWSCIDNIGKHERKEYFDRYIGFGKCIDKTIGEIIEEAILEELEK